MKRPYKIVSLLVITLGLLLPAFQPALASDEPRFTSVQVAEGNSISLTLTGAVLTSYNILATTNLNMPFSPIGVVLTDANGSGSFTDPGTLTLFPQRFYRAQRTL